MRKAFVHSSMQILNFLKSLYEERHLKHDPNGLALGKTEDYLEYLPSKKIDKNKPCQKQNDSLSNSKFINSIKLLSFKESRQRQFYILQIWQMIREAFCLKFNRDGQFDRYQSLLFFTSRAMIFLIFNFVKQIFISRIH